MNDPAECTDNEALLAELDLSETLRGALVALVGEPLEVERRPGAAVGCAGTALYTFQAEVARPITLDDLEGLFESRPLRVFTDHCPCDEDDLYSQYALFEMPRGSGEPCAVTVRLDVGVHRHWLFVDVCVASGSDKTSQKAVEDAIRELESELLGKAWGWFAAVAGQCRLVGLGDVADRGRAADADAAAAAALVRQVAD